MAEPIHHGGLATESESASQRLEPAGGDVWCGFKIEI